MGPDYDDASFWDRKFATGQDVGEWLNSGEALRDAVLSDLDRRESTGKSPRVVQLGPGISKLGSKLCEEFERRGWKGNNIVNVDFSVEAVRLGQKTEDPKDAMQAMPWLHADLRSWRDITSILPFAPFDVIMDKSTCDAIATSEHQTFSPSSDRSNTSLAVLESISQTEPTTLSPVELLGLNLVPLTHEGTRWIALSYSSARFDNLGHLEGHWEVVSRAKMEAPSGLLSAAYAPKMYHWLYVLKRK